MKTSRRVGAVTTASLLALAWPITACSSDETNSRATATVATGSTVAQAPSQTSPTLSHTVTVTTTAVTVSPTTAITFGGGDGLWVGDSESKLAAIAAQRTEFTRCTGYRVTPVTTKETKTIYVKQGVVHGFTWDATDRGIRVDSSTLADVERAYSGMPSARITTMGPSTALLIGPNDKGFHLGFRFNGTSPSSSTPVSYIATGGQPFASFKETC